MQGLTPFKEVQKIPRWIALIVSAPVIILISVPLFSGSSGYEISIEIVGSCLLLSFLLLLFRLETIVRPGKITYRLYPLQLKFRHVFVEDVERVWIREYRPLSEYGGWGIRCGNSGTAVNLKGKTGVQFVFRNGKKFLLGTSQPKPIKDALAAAGFTLSP